MQFKKLCFVLIVALIPVLSSAQDVAGYYIDNNNIRHNVMFKQTDFSDVTSLKYHTENEAFQSLPPDKIKEYGMGNDYKFIRSFVTYDENATDVSVSNEASNKVDNLFLNVLVEGDATLYSYTLNGSDIFFYSLKTNQDTITQLIYKQYRTSEISPIYEINTFRNQVFNDLKCTEMDFKNFRNLKYNRNDLVKVFGSYDACSKNTFVSYSNKLGNHAKLSLSAIGNLNYTGFILKQDGKKSDAKYDLSYGVGIEAALLFPSHKSAVFIRIDYQKYNSKTVLPVNYSSHLYNETNQNYTFDSSAFNVLTGFRSILNDHFYADAGLGVILPSGDIDEVITYPNAPTAHSIKGTIPSGVNVFFGLGLGYVIGHNFGLELRYSTPRGIVDNRYPAKGKLTGIGVGVRYIIN